MREIRLLGTPAILGPSGEVREVRGLQAWAVLARILLSDKPLDRRQLSAEIFPDAADPLGALRWCLAALRRALDDPSAFKGDPIQPDLPDGVRIDVHDLEQGHPAEDDPGDLLGRIDLRATIEFSTWLLVERQRLATLIEERLRQECLDALSRGDARRAIRLAELGVRRDPFDEPMHVLLVKALAANGNADAALAHAERAERSFMDELGTAPSRSMRHAAMRPAASIVPGVSPEAHVRSLLDAGRAALSAGAAEAGIDALRRAARDIEGLAAGRLRCEVLLELGTALVHTVRGHDDEGAVLLKQAAALGAAAGQPDMSAAALRELGYVDAMAGRRPSAEAYLTEALAIAAGPERQAGVQGVIGFNLVDWGRLPEGIAAYEAAIELARSSASLRREAWCLGVGARGLLAEGRAGDALAWLERCLQLVEELRWLAFRPWVVALRAEALLATGSAPSALRPELESAFALSCQLDDPCWEGAVGRALALTHEREGACEQALGWLTEASRRTVRYADRFIAQQVDILGDEARVLRKLGREEAAQKRAGEWIALAVRAHMPRSITQAAAFITGVAGA